MAVQLSGMVVGINVDCAVRQSTWTMAGRRSWRSSGGHRYWLTE
jgi:hypothetical protein